MSMIDRGEAMEARPSYRYENKEYLLKTIMNQLGMTEEDLEQDPSWVKAKVREANIDKVLDSHQLNLFQKRKGNIQL